jgi:hypothetical protein
LPPKGSLAVGLVILERLKEGFDLRLPTHMAKGGGQVKGVSGEAVAKILADFGESRRLSVVGGRSNRGTPAVAKTLLGALGRVQLGTLPRNERNAVLRTLQASLVEGVREYFNRQRLQPAYSPASSTRSFVGDILRSAKQAGKWGPVAQYLIGAKLQLRCPSLEIRNESESAADASLRQPGDFIIQDTSFHVTVAPNLGHFEKCGRNLEEGRRVYLLVPEEVVFGARQTADSTGTRGIAVEAIESFVAQNVEELGQFAQEGVARQIRRLLEVYNERVDAIEVDKSLLIEVPRTLAR